MDRTIEIDCHINDKAIDDFYAGKSSVAFEFMGCHFDEKLMKFRFCLWAPNAKAVSVVGDFNDWDESDCEMSKYRGLWVAFTDSAQIGDTYKYLIDGADGEKIYKADPYAFYSEKPPKSASKIYGLPKYKWKDKKFLQKRAKDNIQELPLSIYELHLSSWCHDSDCKPFTYRDIAGRLVDYVLDMGFTHVELMPVNEYPFDGSWGYQVTGFFSITSRFGCPEDFMYMVDTLHSAGIGVIVDWVPAHFPKDAHGLARFDGTWLYEHKNPLRREHPEWGTHEFNYGRPEVASFLLSSAELLIDLYHIDGLRVDAVSSMLYLDYGRNESLVQNKDGGNIDYEAVKFIKLLNETLLGKNIGVITVAEEATSFPLVSAPPYDGGLGFTFKWNMGFMHDTLNFSKTDPYFLHGSHEKITFLMHYAFSESFILPYSHDEVVHGKLSMIEKMHGDYDTKFSALRLLYAFMFAHPGKKLMFMGNEFAQFIEWDYMKPLDWLLLDYDAHKGMRSFVRELNNLYKTHSALYEIDKSWDGFEWLIVDDKENSVFSFIRKSKKENIICIYNFLPADHEVYNIALPHAGSLKLLLSSDEKEYYGSGRSVKKNITTRKKKINGESNVAVVRVPGKTALFYRYSVS